MPVFNYKKLFDYGKDKTRFRLLDEKSVKVKKVGGKDHLLLKPAGLTLLAESAFHDIAYFLREAHLKQVAAILDAPDASNNDKFVAFSLLKNAVIAAEQILPLCQDTGTANIIGYKGEGVRTGSDDAEALSKGVFRTWTRENLRYSQLAPLTLLEEANTHCNLPAQIDIAAVSGNEYKFLFISKGGGSSNKTSLFQETPAFLNEKRIDSFLREKIKSLGVAACPPYHIAIVIGGTSPELCLKTVKMASAGYLDNLPVKGNKSGCAFRDLALEQKALAIARESGLGAQFGGRYLALDVRVIRLPRHAASCPVGIGLSCNADRNIKAKITRDGIFLEELERNPARFLKSSSCNCVGEPIPIDLNKPMPEILGQLSGKPVGTLLSLSGSLVVARDIAHARLMQIFEKEGRIPDYFKNHPVYYAGPAKTPKGMASGSFGPTTAARMDSYLNTFMKAGASMVTLAKGNRTSAVSEACKAYGGFYLGTIGGAAALVARENITHCETLDFPELGMEAVRRIKVKDLPAFILTDNKGENLFK